MNISHRFLRMLYAQVLLGIGIYALVVQNPGLLLVAGALGVLAGYVAEGPSGRPLPKAVVNLGAMVAVAWLLIKLFYFKGDILLGMGNFTVWLQVLLLYSRKRNRDYGQVLALSLLLMIGAAILSGGTFLFALLLLLYCLVSLYTVLLFQFKISRESVRETNQSAAPRGVWVSMPKVVTGRGFRGHFRMAAVTLGLMVLLISVPVFLLMPRYENLKGEGLGGWRGTEGGFNTEVRMRGDPGQDRHGPPVMHLSLRDAGGRSVGSRDRAWLLRGTALDSYNRYEEIWERSYRAQGSDFTLEISEQGRALLPEEAVAGRRIEGEVTLRVTRENILFTLHPVARLQSPNLEGVTFNPEDYRLTATDVVDGPVVYSFQSMAEWTGDLAEAYPAHLPEKKVSTRFRSRTTHNRNWPIETRRVREHTLRILRSRGFERDPGAEGTGEDERIVHVLAEYFRANYQYTLENAPLEGEEDPVIEFLFERRKGHCELYAAGLVAMARSIGIPARVVTGYRASEYNRLGDFYVVRPSNAHAWVEVRIPGRGWITVDPTPPAAVAREHAMPDRWYTAIQELYQWAELAWVRGVVSYNDASRQQMTGRAVRAVRDGEGGVIASLQRVLEWFAGLKDRFVFGRLAVGVMGMIVVAIGIGIVILVRFALVRRRRLAALQLKRLPRRERRTLVKRLRFYLVMLDMLDRHGYHRPVWQTPFGFAQELAEAEPACMEPVLNLTEQFYEIRFGYREMNRERQGIIRQALAELEKNLIGRKRSRDS